MGFKLDNELSSQYTPDKLLKGGNMVVIKNVILLKYLEVSNKYNKAHGRQDVVD